MRLASVHYLCALGEVNASRLTRGHLTIHSGEWAYCTADTDDPHEHEWFSTGGIAYDDIATVLASSIESKLEVSS